jgi:FkbH-like protein
MPYTKPAIKSFASELIAQLSFLFTEEKKVIILDCDNTLWKGVIGEDGIDSIACDKNGDGILYYNFQLFIKAKKEEGFLLCLCSKNNEEDVKEAFTKLNFPLKWTDFIVKKINWQDKVENIKQIGKELNLGVSSFIFIDDNLFELNSIAQLLSDVSCIHFTGSYPDFITMSNSFLFRRKLILSEDLEKTNQYIQEQLRSEHEAAFNSIDDFISSLDIKLDIRLNDFADLPRLAQMTGKTNQFNFNKHEYNADELRSFTETGRIYSLKVSDKYGDYGTVGLILMKLNGRQAVLENYLLSCRSLGKKIEYTFFDHVKNQLLSEGIEITDIQFKANDKNLPAQTFIKSINYGSKS